MSEELKILDELISSVDNKEVKKNLKQKKKKLVSQIREVHQLKKCHEKILKLAIKKDKEEEKLKNCMKKISVDEESIVESSEEEN